MPRPPPSQRTLTVAVISPDPALAMEEDAVSLGRQAQRCALLEQALLDAGYAVVAVLPATPALDERIAALKPDLVIVDAESGVRDLLEHVVLTSRDTPRPIVLFTDDDDTETAQLAITAGVTALLAPIQN